MLTAALQHSPHSAKRAGGREVIENKARSTRGSARHALLESAFVNWRLPSYLGSLAYRAGRVSTRVAEAMMDLRLDLKTREGQRIFARLRDVNAPAEVFGLREYEHPWLDWPSVEYVLDIGAHVGAFTLWVTARSRCHVLALEPNPSTRRMLEANVRRQGLGDRVEVRPWALAGGRGSRSLRPAPDSAATSLVSEMTSGDVQVEAMDLAGAIVASGFPRIDIVKMDIEGAEYEVFESVSSDVLEAPACWVIECHPHPGKAMGSVERALASAGYETAALDKPHGQQLVIARRRVQAPTSHHT